MSLILGALLLTPLYGCAPGDAEQFLSDVSHHYLPDLASVGEEDAENDEAADLRLQPEMGDTAAVEGDWDPESRQTLEDGRRPEKLPEGEAEVIPGVSSEAEAAERLAPDPMEERRIAADPDGDEYRDAPGAQREETGAESRYE